MLSRRCRMPWAGHDARMNFPSRLGGNWEWRMNEDDMSGELAEKLRELNELFLR